MKLLFHKSVIRFNPIIMSKLQVIHRHRESRERPGTASATSQALSRHMRTPLTQIHTCVSQLWVKAHHLHGSQIFGSCHIFVLYSNNYIAYMAFLGNHAQKSIDSSLFATSNPRVIRYMLLKVSQGESLTTNKFHS